MFKNLILRIDWHCNAIFSWSRGTNEQHESIEELTQNKNYSGAACKMDSSSMSEVLADFCNASHQQQSSCL